MGLFGQARTRVIAKPPYLLDLVRCDFWLFSKLKYALPRTRHESSEDVKSHSLNALEANPAKGYKKCMENLIGVDWSVGMLVLAQKLPILKAIINISCENVFFFLLVRVKFEQMICSHAEYNFWKYYLIIVAVGKKTRICVRNTSLNFFLWWKL